MVTVTQNIGELIIFWVIGGLFQRRIPANRITRPIHVQLREIGSCSLKTQRKLRRNIQRFFNKLRNLNNMTKLSSKKRERHDAQLLTTKSRTKSTDEPGSGEDIRLNHIMKDLIINGYADGHYTQDGERKRKKQWKEEAKDRIVKGIEEDQPSWIDTLKEEIEKIK
jgi:hypothetical protein